MQVDPVFDKMLPSDKKWMCMCVRVCVTPPRESEKNITLSHRSLFSLSTIAARSFQQFKGSDLIDS